jgi:pimeloyl-ACP methyl ester carboxylesterase
VKRIVFASVLGMLAMVLVAVGYLYAIQGSMIYFPRSYAAAELAAAEARFELLRYETSAGRQTAFLAAPDGGRTAAGAGSNVAPGRVWLLFGGNGARALDWAGFIGDPSLSGDAFLLVDYPGYGANEGKPTPARIEESIRAAVSAAAIHLGLTEAELAPRMAVLGHSLGAAAALCAAEAYDVEQIVLISPFTSMRDMAALSFYRPLTLLLRHDYDNRARLRRMLGRADGQGDVPGSASAGAPDDVADGGSSGEQSPLRRDPSGLHVTIFHGEADSVIPVSMGRELAAMDPARITFHALPGADHNDVVLLAGPLLYEAMSLARDASEQAP